MIHRIGTAVQLFQEATDTFDDAAAEILGLNRTDMKCLGVITRRGQASASEIARSTFLTRGATTTALDRLEKAGYARRVRDPNDRRGVLMELTEVGQKKIFEIWGPLVELGPRFLAPHDRKTLQAILDFIESGARAQLEHAEKLRAGGAGWNQSP